MTDYRDFKVDNIEDLYRIVNADFWHVFVNLEDAPEDSTWHFSVSAEYEDEEEFNFKEDFGKDNVYCSCDECRFSFGSEIKVYYSIYKALTWVKEHKGKSVVCLWVNSSKFLFDEVEGVLFHYDCIYSCDFLRTLGNNLNRLLSELEVEVDAYELWDIDAWIQFYEYPKDK
jgi:hypothetical protein